MIITKIHSLQDLVIPCLNNSKQLAQIDRRIKNMHVIFYSDTNCTVMFRMVNIMKYLK